MKLVMFTPTSIRSAIARVAALVTEALRTHGHDVTVVSADSPAQADVRKDLGPSILAWIDDVGVYRACADADVSIYQIGDHLDFHRGCLRWLPVSRGIACLHDLFLGDLFISWCDAFGAAPEPTVERWYGPDIARTYRAHAAVVDFPRRTMADAPMVEWLCSQALAVLTHGGWNLSRVLASTPGPVAVAPLPYRPSWDAELPARAPSGPRWRVLTVGHVNANKRVDVVINAIAMSAHLRDRVAYHVVGPVDTGRARELVDLALAAGVRLHLAGSVDDAALARAYQETDVVVALRNPVLEAASASVIEAMWLGKPVVVSDSGSYAELPSDCVIKVDPANELGATMQALEMLLGQPETALGYGERAARHARTTHTAAGYASTLVELARLALPLAAPIEAAAGVVRTYASWGQPDVADPFLLPSMLDLWSAMP